MTRAPDDRGFRLLSLLLPQEPDTHPGAAAPPTEIPDLFGGRPAVPLHGLFPAVPLASRNESPEESFGTRRARPAALDGDRLCAAALWDCAAPLDISTQE